MQARPELPGEFYDRHGMPISFWRMAELKMHDDTRDDIVAVTDHGNLTISTRWLGWVNGHNEHGRPLIFETAMSDDDHFVICGRYATEALAALHHSLILGRLRATQPLPALPPGRPA